MSYWTVILSRAPPTRHATVGRSDALPNIRSTARIEGGLARASSILVSTSRTPGFGRAIDAANAGRRRQRGSGAIDSAKCCETPRY
jgi:hypothetical protein